MSGDKKKKNKSDKAKEKAKQQQLSDDELEKVSGGALDAMVLATGAKQGKFASSK
jgi:bacteriocin-like protein